jgi:hypothetical protein
LEKSADKVNNIFRSDRSGRQTSMMCKRRAGALVRSNLPPLMGRRDAVLDAAETLIRVAKSDPDVHRGTLFSYLNGLFAAADSNTSRLSGMFNNQDTVAREERLALHIGILAKLAASLDDFRALEVRMQKAAAFYADDPGNEFDAECTGRINERLAVVEHNLLEQLCEYFDRVRARIARYRQYAVKNFSKEYLDCYQRSYMSVKERCDEAFELFSVKISTPNMRSVSDEKLPD